MLEIFLIYVCVLQLHRAETFGRKHSLVAHRHQNSLSIQSTYTQFPGRVTGSKVQTRHLWPQDQTKIKTTVAETKTKTACKRFQYVSRPGPRLEDNNTG